MASVGKQSKYALEIMDVKKSFYENLVLDGVSFELKPGEILGFLGANGAGKSTLMKIITGVYKMDSGMIKINGNQVSGEQISKIRENSVAMVYQEFSLIPSMTVTENLFLGSELKKYGLIDEKRQESEAKKMFKEFGIDINPSLAVEELSIGNQQLVEIVKALMKKPLVLIMDEPTASLANNEINLLFKFMRKLKQNGISIILITHHMQQVLEVCDTVIVLREGKVVMNQITDELSIDTMVEAMVGKDILSKGMLQKKKLDNTPRALLEINNLYWKGKLNDINFKVHYGEVIGIAGLLGSGRTELVKCLYGLLTPSKGTITFDNKQIEHKLTPEKAIKIGMCYVPENRRKNGIIAIHSVENNMLISIWNRILNYGIINKKISMQKVNDMIKNMKIKCVNKDQEIRNLSGGNQQKVVFAKGLLINPKLMILDDPTVGVDVEAKESIVKIIREFANRGSAVLLVSSEFDQLEKVCDRILVLKEGTIKKELQYDRDCINEIAISEAVQLN